MTRNLAARSVGLLKRRRFLQASAAALGASTLSSCGWTLANVRPVAQARTSNANKLYIFTWSSYTDEALLKSFTQQTGIEVVADVFDSNEAMLAKVQAGGGGAYSIIYPSDYMVEKMAKDRLLQELDLSRIEGLNQLFPNFQNPIYDPNNRYSIPVSWGTTGLVYNAKKLKSEPQDWNYLWENLTKLNRRVTLLNDVREVMGATLKMLGYSLNSTDPQQIRAAYDRLVQLKSAIASFTSDAWRPQILAGDLLISMAYSVDANAIIEENPDLQYVIPYSGASLWTDTLVIPKSAPNPDAAYAWINFMLQPAVAVELTERLNFATANKVAYEKLPTKISGNPTLFPAPDILAKCESVAPVALPIAQIYDRYWTQLTSG